jgi:hypothetical protein
MSAALCYIPSSLHRGWGEIQDDYGKLNNMLYASPENGLLK